MIVAMGPGECSHAAALGSYAIRKGHKVCIAAVQRENLVFFRNGPHFGFANLWHTPTPQSLWRLVKKEAPDVMVLCNSKIFGAYRDFQKSPPVARPFTVSLDSNWLFNSSPKTRFPYVPWVDNYLIVLPQKVYRLGLKKYGGEFSIPRNPRRKMRVVGLIPSYRPLARAEVRRQRKRYGVAKNEKLIFCYGGYGVTDRFRAVSGVLSVTQKLTARGYRVKVLVVGDRKRIKKRYFSAPWLVIRESLSFKEYYSALASADLVYQHQGLGTLAQAIGANVPVIANVSNPSKKAREHTHAWEVAPFAKAGVCKMLFFKDPPSRRLETVTTLLYSARPRRAMLAKQREIYSRGEHRTLELIGKFLKAR